MEIQSFEEWSASRRPQAYMEAGITAEPILNLLLLKPLYRKLTSKTRYGLMRQL